MITSLSIRRTISVAVVALTVVGMSALSASAATAASSDAATDAQVAPTAAPIGALTLEDGRTVEVPTAYLQEDAPEWVEYEEGDVSLMRAGGVCTKPLCGKIVNKGSGSMLVGTDYSSNGQLASGARRMTINAGQTAGAPYDWDAVYIPPGFCGTFYTGAGYYFRSTNSRVGMSTGWWHKVDDLGAHAILRSGSCA